MQRSKKIKYSILNRDIKNKRIDSPLTIGNYMKKGQRKISILLWNLKQNGHALGVIIQALTRMQNTARCAAKRGKQELGNITWTGNSSEDKEGNLWRLGRWLWSLKMANIQYPESQ